MTIRISTSLEKYIDVPLNWNSFRKTWTVLLPLAFCVVLCNPTSLDSLDSVAYIHTSKQKIQKWWKVFFLFRTPFETLLSFRPFDMNPHALWIHDFYLFHIPMEKLSKYKHNFHPMILSRIVFQIIILIYFHFLFFLSLVLKARLFNR